MPAVWLLSVCGPGHTCVWASVLLAGQRLGHLTASASHFQPFFLPFPPPRVFLFHPPLLLAGAARAPLGGRRGFGSECQRSHFCAPLVGDECWTEKLSSRRSEAKHEQTDTTSRVSACHRGRRRVGAMTQTGGRHPPAAQA